jgi:N-acetyl sugar amidotransferase
MQIPRPLPLDLEAFHPDAGSPDAKYGLPREVKFCSRCVISNQRPNSAVEFQHDRLSKKKTIAFDENAVCDACKFAERKAREIDWEARREELEKLCDEFRSSDGSYDCIVPGSGGKDSAFAADVLKREFGMHPLTVTWAPHIYTEWGWKNFQAWIHSGQDNVLFTPNGKVHRLLTRLAVDNLLHPFQPFVLGQKLLAPKLALKFGIPLVFFGENESEYGNPISDTDSAERDASYFSSEELMNSKLGGVPVGSLMADFGVEMAELQPYLPAKEADLSVLGVRVHYLGYYLKWHPQSAYYYAVEHTGFRAAPERTPGTYSKYNSIDDKIDDLHYLTTGIKFGLGRASYDAAQEIRSGDISREEGVLLVQKFDHEYPERFMEELLEYLSIDEKSFGPARNNFEQPDMTREYFENLMNSFRSPHIWQTLDGIKWELRNPIWDAS